MSLGGIILPETSGLSLEDLHCISVPGGSKAWFWVRKGDVFLWQASCLSPLEGPLARGNADFWILLKFCCCFCRPCHVSFLSLAMIADEIEVISL